MDILAPWVAAVIAIFPNAQGMTKATAFNTYETRYDCEMGAAMAVGLAIDQGGLAMYRCVERGERPAREVALEAFDLMAAGE